VLVVGSHDPIDGFDAVIADGEAPAGIVDQAIELICVSDEREAARWRALGAAATVPVTVGLPTRAWNSLSAFGSVAGEPVAFARGVP
jgi:hypothetical protein